jgi:6-pyruvoyltetrahydropterin/6-carboxytetrahydropterin synthase
MYRLQVKSHFDAAHYIKDYVGKCSRMHGHRWEVEVVVEGKMLDSKNMLLDFGEMKLNLETLLEAFLDHHLLNETLKESNVTAEFLAKWVYDRFVELTWMEGIRLARVAVWESPDCCVKYYGEEKA